MSDNSDDLDYLFKDPQPRHVSPSWLEWLRNVEVSTEHEHEQTDDDDDEALVKFLLARISEDEEAAKQAGGVPWIAVESLQMVHVDPTVIRDNKLAYGHLGYVASAEQQYIDHIARQNPAHVIAECAAKRRIIAQAIGWSAPPPRPSNTNFILRVLATAYRDHPLYEEAWRI